MRAGTPESVSEANGVEEARMSARTRLKAGAGEPARRRTVIRRPLRQIDGEAPAEEFDTATSDEEFEAATADEDVENGASDEGVDSGASAGDVNRATPTESRATVRRGAGARRGPRLLVACLVVVLAAAVTAAGVAGYGWYSQQRLDQARQEALAAARQTTVNFVSVSAATVDRDLQRVTAGATADFKDEFTRGAPQVRAAVVENNVDSHGSVLRAALVSGDSDSAVVLVAVDATVKNVKAPQGRLSHYRIQVNVTRDAKSGRWLVSKLQFVG
jgi:Mce-associated membrane protein